MKRHDRYVMWKPHHYDAIDEGYAALCIAVLNEKVASADDAFDVYDGKSLKRRTWTKEMIKDVETLRSKGMMWKDIGELYGLSGVAVQKTYSYHKRFCGC